MWSAIIIIKKGNSEFNENPILQSSLKNFLYSKWFNKCY